MDYGIAIAPLVSPYVLWGTLAVIVAFMLLLVLIRRREARQKRDPWGCMAGTVTIMPGVDLTAPSGEKWNADEGRL